MIAPRTRLEFPLHQLDWAVVDAWAVSIEFVVVERSDNKRMYKKAELPGRTIYVELNHAAGQLLLQAWIRIAWWYRVATLFSLPEEINIDQEGLPKLFLIWADRLNNSRVEQTQLRARTAVNRLLAMFRQPAI